VAFLFAHYHVSFYAAETVKRKGNNLLFVYTGNQIPISQTYKFKQELMTLIKVLNNKHVGVVSVNESGFVVQINNILLNIFSLSNIVTINEVFIEKLYGISTPGNNNIMIDVGMNVGYASLFFASSDRVDRVYSFEPFPETFEEANKNINLNTAIKKKIIPFNYGISNYSGTVEVPMLESGSAIAATNTLMIEYTKITPSKTIKVNLKSIEQVLDEVLTSHPDQNIFLKIDCEGEEYGIMESLNKNRHMKGITGFFIEWHVKGPESIITVLNDNHFIVLDLPRTDVDSGMLYAFKE